ncbi:MAG: hypothetical protein Q8O30_08030 [Candidatus Omnitrophota bacterium]|nr:hypothetical protein [Candidatus Omnitrophota bacterium]
MLLDKEYYFRFLKTLGKDYLRIGEAKKARLFLYKALKSRPFDISIE